MSHKTSLLIVVLLFIFHLLTAQNTTIEGVEKAWLHSFGTVMEGDDLEGYYFFYGEKKRYGQRNFQLQAYDRELKLIFKREIMAPAGMILQNMAFDGTHFMLKVYRPATDTYGYLVFDKNGKLVDKDNERRGLREVQNRKLNTAPESNTLIALPGGGFLSQTPIFGIRQGWEIECFESTGASKWKRSSDPKFKFAETVGLLAVSKNTILNYTTRYDLDRPSKFTYRLQALDAQTGEILFEAKLKGSGDSGTHTELLKGFIDDDTNEILLLGISRGEPRGFGGAAGRVGPTGFKKSENAGLYISKLNRQGELLNEKHIKWDDAASFLRANEWHKKLGQPTWFHEVIQTKDGGYFVVGEQFNLMPRIENTARKITSGVSYLTDVFYSMPIHMKDNYVGVYVGDLVIYEFSSELELQNISTFLKDGAYFNVFKNNQTIHTISKQVLALDLFGFHAINSDSSEDFSVEMMEYYRFESKKHNEFHFKTVTKEGENYQENSLKMESASGAPSIRKILPAKDGYIMISEFYPNKRKIVNRLERVKN